MSCVAQPARRLSKQPAPVLAALFVGVLHVYAPAARAAGKVNVLYAGSLVNLMEHGIGPAFDKASGNTLQGFAGGSDKVANEIKSKQRQGDVFISANPKVNDSLMGAANGEQVSWYITFAQSPLVIGYSASSKFAADFKSKPWYQVLQEPGIKIGRTDPKLDPKGRLTEELMSAAETLYKSPGLSQKILNPSQVLPEETLVERLQSGQLDVGFFYSIETTDAKIPPVALSPEIAPKATYTVTILHNAPNAEGANQFLAFLLGPNGKKTMKEHGLDVQKPLLMGSDNGVPNEVKSLVDREK